MSDTDDDAPPGWQNDLHELLRANDVAALTCGRSTCFPDAVQREAVHR